MAYNFLTQYNSPNYTPAADTQATWGRPRTIEKLVIHWWGDPATNPSFEGVVAHLCNPDAGVSAHFVATGTGRRVANLVDTKDNSWATMSANPYTISIECDPRCRDEDYDVIGELVAELRATFGDLPLIRHSDIVNTTCPGNYDLNRINAVAATKIARAEDQYGLATTKPAPTPAPAPAPTPAPVYTPTKLANPIDFVAARDTPLMNFDTEVSVKTIKKGETYTAYASVAANNSTYYMTQYSYAKGVHAGVRADDLEKPVIIVPPITPPAPTPVPAPVPTKDDEQDKRLTAIEALLKVITDFLSSIFSGFKK